MFTMSDLAQPVIEEHPLDHKQQLIISIVQKMMKERKQFHESLNCMLERDDSDSEDDMNLEEPHSSPPSLLTHSLLTAHTIETSFDWQKFLLVVGKAGTCKSYAITKLIETCIACDRKVMVATPTGYLTTEYKDKFPEDIDADTIHGSFHYPVSQKEQPTINWNLSNYDLLIVDELSMAPIPMFDHMFATVSELPIFPIVVLASDDRQLQPIDNIEGTIQMTESVMTSDKLKNVNMKVVLTEQHRSQDKKYARFLDHICVWQPSQKLLNEIQKEKILFVHDPNDDEIFQALTDFPESTVITVFCHAANRINNDYITRI